MIEHLLGEVVDHEKILYTWLKEKWTEGITFSGDLVTILNPNSFNQITKVSDAFRPDKSFLFISPYQNIRTAMFPYTVRFLHNQDLVLIEPVDKGIRIKLINSLFRNELESKANIFDTEKEMLSIKNQLISTVEFLKGCENHIAIDEVEFLEFLGFTKRENFKLKHKKTRKGFIDIDLTSSIDSFVSRYKDNTVWPINFSSLQEYRYYYYKRGSKKFKDINQEMLLHTEENKAFWSKPVINLELLTFWIEKHW